MPSFLQQHAGAVIGFLKGWDRLRLRGTLRCIAHGKGAAGFLIRSGRRLLDFGKYALGSSGQLRQSIEELAGQAGRPLIYLSKPGVNKEQMAREIARRDGIEQGLICVLAAVEPCWSFRLVKQGGPNGQVFGLQRSYRKCQHLYQYSIHPDFGFMHVRLQTWMPFNLHMCLNGREWLSRQMDAAGIKYLRRENCFVWIEDVAAAQQLMQQQTGFDWERALARVVQQSNPWIDRVLAPYDPQYYWSIEESEWASDVMFGSEAKLNPLYAGLIRHGIESFGSRDVMRFLGQRVPLTGTAHRHDYREVVSDVKSRPEGIRLKHRLGDNSVKMYNKQGSVLRVETTLNNMRQFKTPRKKNGKVVWEPMRKGVSDARRRAQVSDQANERYLEAMATVSTPAPLKDLTQGLSTRVKWKKQSVRGLNLLEDQDAKLLSIVGGGEFLIHGVRNRDLQAAWFEKPTDDPAERRRRCGQMTRKLRMLRAHGLIHKLPHTHRYVLSEKGRQVISVMAVARNADISQLMKAA